MTYLHVATRKVNQHRTDLFAWVPEDDRYGWMMVTLNSTGRDMVRRMADYYGLEIVDPGGLLGGVPSGGPT